MCFCVEVKHKKEGDVINRKNLLLLGDKLKNARENKDLTLRQVESMLGISFGHINAFEHGKVDRPKLETLQKFIDFYGLDSDDVMHLAGRIPQDVYWKLIRNPKFVSLVRTLVED
jgi:transcriptional regulator with XRE-family HTH domain